jgi:hypothetical protein
MPMLEAGDKIRRYEIELFINGDVKKNKNELLIVACRDYKCGKKASQYMVVEEGVSYTIIQTMDEKYATYSILSRVKVWEMQYHSKSLNDFVHAYVYTSQSNDKKIYTKLKSEMEKYLKDKYGRYGNYIGLLKKIEV